MGRLWPAIKEKHITSSEYLLKKINPYVGSNSSQSRWGIISILIVIFETFLAIFFASYGIYIALLAYYGDWDKMQGWMILIFVIATVGLILAIAALVITVWIGWYFVRKPLPSTIEGSLDSISRNMASMAKSIGEMVSVRNNIQNDISEINGIVGTYSTKVENNGKIKTTKQDNPS